jgi:hypothetical protein
VRYLRLKESTGAPELVNLRDASETRMELEAQGFDLDKGMVAEISGKRYEGADALNALALLTTPSGIFNRATAALFSRPALSRVIYPLLRAGRNATLTMLGRQPFKSEDAGWQALFQVFALVFGLFAIVHFFINAFRYTAFEVYPSTWVILACGAGLLLRPGSKRIFIVLICAMLVDAWLRAPMQSNHTILKNFLLLAFLGSGIWHGLKGSQFWEFFRDAVPVGRVLLLVMYFFGVFHKINEGFLDPSVSCAVALWERMPWPLYLLDHPAIHYLTIYGTFVVEAAIVVMLLVPKFRHLGIVLGIGFHGLLALSGYAMYPAFSTLTVALHVLYLSPAQAQHIVGSDPFRGLVKGLASWRGALLLPAIMVLIGWFAIIGNFNLVALVWLILALLVAWVILFPGGRMPSRSDEPAGTLLWSRLGWLNLIGALFFVSCALPYAGIKTAQSMNMFSNLRIEGGINNHLIMRHVPMPFGYLADFVEIRGAEGDRVLELAAEESYGLAYYHLLDRLSRSPETVVSYERDGTLFSDQTAESLADDIADTLHPEWFRKWFHFQWVRLGDPTPCT